LLFVRRSSNKFEFTVCTRHLLEPLEATLPELSFSFYEELGYFLESFTRFIQDSTSTIVERRYFEITRLTIG
jgi:hypothetical protein